MGYFQRTALTERTSLWTVLISLIVGAFGACLLWLSTYDNWWSGQNWAIDANSIQATLNSLGGLLIATVPVTLFWELWGKRKFLDEVLEKAGIAKEIEQAGIVGIYDSFQRITEWDSLFAQANEIDIFFAYGHSWRANNHQHMKTFLQKRYARMRVALPDPKDDTTVAELCRRFGYEPDNLRRHISEALEDFKGLAPDGRKVEIFLFAGMVPHLSFYRFGSVSLFSPYTHRRERAAVPAFVVRDGGHLFSYLRDEFSAIKNQSRRVFPESTPTEGVCS